MGSGPQSFQGESWGPGREPCAQEGRAGRAPLCEDGGAGGGCGARAERGRRPARPLTWAAPPRTRRGLRRGGRPEPTLAAAAAASRAAVRAPAARARPPSPALGAGARGAALGRARRLLAGCAAPGPQVCGARGATCAQVPGRAGAAGRDGSRPGSTCRLCAARPRRRQSEDPLGPGPWWACGGCGEGKRRAPWLAAPGPGPSSLPHPQARPPAPGSWTPAPAPSTPASSPRGPRRKLKYCAPEPPMAPHCSQGLV